MRNPFRHMAWLVRTSVLVSVFVPALVMAHPRTVEEPGPRNWNELSRAWELDPVICGGLLVTIALYGIGITRLWRNGGRGRSISVSEALAFFLGWLSLVVALVSPLHPWGKMLFAAHMTQHEVLMLLAAPLLVLGKPLFAFVWALPAPLIRRLGAVSRVHAVRAGWVYLTLPLSAFVIQAIALWIWHIPSLFQATLSSDLVHAAQHLSFLLTSILFWWAILHASRGTARYGITVLSLFLTSLESGALGALLTVVGRPWYPIYAQTAPIWGLSPLEDQELGGLIMWIPAGAMYAAAALIAFGVWLREDPPPLLARSIERLA